MQAIQQIGQRGVRRYCGVPLGAGGAKAAAGGAGVINSVAVLGGAFRVDAQPHAFACRFCGRAELCQLGGGVKDDMVRVLHQFIHFVRTVGRAEHMDFLAGHLFRTQAGFKQAAGLGTGQVWRQQGVAVIIAECLLGQQHLAAGALGQAAQNFRVAGQGVFIQQVAGGRQFFQFRRDGSAECRKRRPHIPLVHQSTSTGLWFSLRGRPYLSSASRNGSGLNSSTVYTPGLVHSPVSIIKAPHMAGTPVV